MCVALLYEPKKMLDEDATFVSILTIYSSSSSLSPDSSTSKARSPREMPSSRLEGVLNEFPHRALPWTKVAASSTSLSNLSVLPWKLAVMEVKYSEVTDDQLAWLKSVDFPDVFPVKLFTTLIMPLPVFRTDIRESIEMQPSRHNVNPRSTCEIN